MPGGENHSKVSLVLHGGDKSGFSSKKICCVVTYKSCKHKAHAKNEGKPKDIPNPYHATQEHQARQDHRPSSRSSLGSSKNEQNETDHCGSLISSGCHETSRVGIPQSSIGQSTTIGEDLELRDTTPRNDGRHSVAHLVDPGTVNRKGI